MRGLGSSPRLSRALGHLDMPAGGKPLIHEAYDFQPVWFRFIGLSDRPSSALFLHRAFLELTDPQILQ